MIFIPVSLLLTFYVPFYYTFTNLQPNFSDLQVLLFASRIYLSSTTPPWKHADKFPHDPNIPKNIDKKEWMPFSPKNESQFYLSDMAGVPILSYCTRPSQKNQAGTRAQTCFPAAVWTSICSATVYSSDQLLRDAFNHEDYDEDLIDLHTLPWRQTCFQYELTWPRCLSKKEVRDYCSAWHRVPPFERRYIKLYITRHRY